MYSEVKANCALYSREMSPFTSGAAAETTTFVLLALPRTEVYRGIISPASSRAKVKLASTSRYFAGYIITGLT